ncbi:putative reverse transcriptase domain-containing protein [Tanacetum coccineum]
MAMTAHTSGIGARRTERVTRESRYQDFMKWPPHVFKGTEGVVELTQWFERMETVFRISNCSVENQIKFSTWYNQRFQELALLCVRMFPEESDKVERYVGGLPDMIHGSVVASKPKTMQEATEMATELMDKKISTFAERQAENKRKLDNNHQAQQQLPKRQNVVQAYAAVTGERKEYAGTLPLCNKCKFHHNGPCTVKCANCKRVGHLTRDCWSSAATNNQRTLTCYECGNQGHYKSDCPKLKNRNHGNQAEGDWNTWNWCFALGEEKDQLEFPQELSKVHNMFHVSNLKKCYAEPLAVLLDGLHLDDKLHFVEEPLEIVGREVKWLKRSRIPLVKVRWNSKRGPEFTWEREDQFKKKYPHLFTKTASSSSAAS